MSSAGYTDARLDTIAGNKEMKQFHLPPTHEPYLPSLASRKASPPLARYQLVLLDDGGTRGEKLAQSFYAAFPAETRNHDLLIASPTLYRQHHDTIDIVAGQKTTATGVAHT